MTTNQLLINIDKLIYHEISEYMLSNFPELKEKFSIYDSEDGVYFLMYHFSNLYITEINKNENSLFFIKATKFINELAKSNNLEVINILKVGILEILYSTKLIREKVRNILSKECLVYFNHYSEYYL